MTVQRLNHVAYRCRDAQETTEFYADVLGLRLAHTIVQDRVPSTQELAPHAHIFFELGDGSWVAFFDVSTDDGMRAKSPATIHPNERPCTCQYARGSSAASATTAASRREPERSSSPALARARWTQPTC